MPLIDITNPKIINFLLENYEKETRKRIQWIGKHKDKILEAAKLKRKPHDYFEEDVVANTMVVGMAAITRDHISAASNRRKKLPKDDKSVKCLKDIRRPHPIVDIGLGDPEDDPRLARPDTDLSPDPIMKPIDPNVAEILHKSLPEFGRLSYLKQRNKISPDKKYYFPQTMYWEYGWQIEEKKVPRATHGSCSVLMNLLKKNIVGPQPDPPHYKELKPGAYTKCVQN